MREEASPGETELAWIELAALGDHEAFRRLVLIYESPLLAYLTQMLGNREHARDIAQETFIAIFRALPRWQPPEHSSDRPLAPWLYRIATNRALNLLQRQPEHAPLLTDASLDGLRGEQQQRAISSINVEEQYAIREMLQQALRKLTAEDAACLVLRFISGESYMEIAQRLGISSEAARKRVTRGLAALKAAYIALEREVRA